MTLDQASELVRSSLWLALQVSGPLLVLCLVVGFVISVFQGATQLADQALNFVPKLLVVVLAVAAMLPWMLGRLVDFSRVLIESIPQSW